MIEFTNLETHPGSTGLSQTEIDVLLSVQKHYLAETVGGELSLGTCILDAQPNGKPAACVYRYNLPGGIFWRNFFGVHERSSDIMAENSIGEILNASSDQSRFFGEMLAAGGFVNTGIYRDGELLVMVLKTTKGRFLFAPQFRLKEAVPLPQAEFGLYHVVAETLALMAREDGILQHSAIRLLQQSQCSPSYIIKAASAAGIARACFGIGQELVEVRTLREWRNKTGASKRPRVFFT